MKTSTTAPVVFTACDGEVCEVCGQTTIAGNDALGQCAGCSQTRTLDHNLRLMAAGVTRNKVTGQYTSIRKARK